MEVNLLGPPTIVGAAHGLPERKKSLELLVYLAAHNGSAAQQTIINDVLADAPRRRASMRLHTYVYDLHKTLKSAAGQGTYIEHPKPLYVLNSEALDVDLWHLRDALAAAGTAADPAARVAALRRVVDTYTGPLADGCAYEWIEPYRHAVHRQVLDAHLALADALTTEPEQALEILDKAMRHDPYAEPVYQAAMRAQAAHGDVEAIRHLRRTLTRRLDEIDTEPTDDTTMLAERLIADVQRRIRRSGARRQGGTAA